MVMNTVRTAERDWSGIMSDMTVEDALDYLDNVCVQMKERDFADMVIYFCQKVSEMNISRKCKMELLGMITAIEMKHDELMPKWISVSEALPNNEEYDWVLGQIRETDSGYLWIPRQVEYREIKDDWYEDSIGWLKENPDHAFEVIAWMPLPERWRGE